MTRYIKEYVSDGKYKSEVDFDVLSREEAHAKIDKMFDRVPANAENAKLVYLQDDFTDDYRYYISYDRPITEDEKDIMINEELAKKKLRQAQYEKLKKEFGE